MADEVTNPQNTEQQNQQQNQQQTQPAPAPQPVQQPAPQHDPNLRTFTQEQLDAIIQRERNKATKGWFTAEQMAEKDSSISALTTERDNVKAENAKLQAEIDAFKNEKFLASKGIPAEMVDFYAFKIGKLVTDKKTFEQAAEEFIKDNPPANTVRMSTGGGVGGNNETKPDINATMNAIIRGQTK
jgi:hypothetical protein